MASKVVAVIAASLVHSICLIKEKYLRIKIRVILWYQDYTDISFIETLIKNSFNYDVKNEARKSYQFYLNLILLLFFHIIFAYSVIGSYINWNDKEKIATYGNFYAVLRFPKKVTLVAQLVIFLSLVKITVAIKILRNDPSFILTMQPLAVICRMNDTTDRARDHPIIAGQEKDGSEITDQKRDSFQITILESDIEEIRSDLRSLIAIARYSTLTGFFGFWLVSFSSYFLYPNLSFTATRIAAFASWSIVIGFIGSQIVWRSITLAIIMAIISQLLKHFFHDEAVSNRGRKEEEDDRENFSIPHLKGQRDRFLQQVNAGVKGVGSVRKFNQFLKLIIGVDFTVILIVTTIGTFLLISAKNFTIVHVLITLIVLGYWILFGIIIYLPSKISCQITQRANELFRMSNQFKWSVIERYRINRSIEGMRHFNSFSCFDFKDMHHTLIVTVCKYFFR